MRIGLDVSMLGGGGGIVTYAESLLGALARQAPQCSLVLWCGSRSAAPIVRHLAPPGSRVVAPGLAGRLLGRWGRLAIGNALPIEAFVGSLDTFHGPNYLLPAQRGKAALVVTVHDLSALRYPQWHPTRRTLVHRVALRRTLRAVDRVITDSQAVRAEVIADLGVPPEKVTAVPLAGAADFHPRGTGELKPVLDRWDLTPGGYLLFSGALEPRKNLIRLLEAVAALRRRRRDVPPLVLAGPPGWRNREVREKIAAAGGTAGYLDYLPREDLAALVAGCAAFVMPSLYEGFGLPVVEAMASGVPVVTSRGGALEEVAGNAAVLVDPRDSDAMAAGIERVLDDAGLRVDLVQRGLARAAQFSWERTARETLAVYDQAIAARRQKATGLRE